MKDLITLLLMIFISSCSYSPKKIKAYVCDCSDKEKLREFITLNTKNANNMSDEEMEDVIHELYTTAIKITCKQKYIYVGSYNIDWEKTKLDSCESVMLYVNPVVE